MKDALGVVDVVQARVDGFVCLPEHSRQFLECEPGLGPVLALDVEVIRMTTLKAPSRNRRG